ncbi:MAG TPA: recombination protein NinB [Modicisalibacter sp.]|nr:recombination protein NinB [Modicisalibacter sp.]
MSKELNYRIDTIGDLQSTLAMAARMAGKGLEAGPIEFVLRRPSEKRSLSQNSKLWPMLTDLSRQVEWPVDGRMQLLPPEDWKTILTSSLQQEQRVAQGIDGGFVMLGKSTSRMRKAEFADLIELIYSFGADRSVAWSEPALKAYESYREAA